jgi:hypothetical protein
VDGNGGAVAVVLGEVVGAEPLYSRLAMLGSHALSKFGVIKVFCLVGDALKLVPTETGFA